MPKPNMKNIALFKMRYFRAILIDLLLLQRILKTVMMSRK